MDELENKEASNPVPAPVDLREQIESLKHVIGSILVLLVIVSGTLTIYLRREMKTASAELEGFRAGTTNMFVVYQKQQGPAMAEFTKRIQQYGQTHPDFAPVLAKWDQALVTLGWKIHGSTAAPPANIAPASNPPKK